MNIAAFDKHRAELNAKREAIVQAKRPEYTEGNVDILNNFKVSANESGITPAQSWYQHFRKHVASIGQFCKATASRESQPMSEPIEGRIADAMNYLELLYGILKEEQARKGDGVEATGRDEIVRRDIDYRLASR